MSPRNHSVEVASEVTVSSLDHGDTGTLATMKTAVMPNHLRRDRRLVDEEEARCIELDLSGLRVSAPGGNVRTILLGGPQRFFEVMS
jgi:hypothetical protein